MNIEIANRLAELRKKNGYSQEELAEKLGISRQAVSKWERAESSPDTSNLIMLARIYNISLDELLDTEASSDDLKKENEDDGKGFFNVEADDENVKVRIAGLNINVDEATGKTHVNLGSKNRQDGIHIDVKNDGKGKKEMKKALSKKTRRQLAIKELVSATLAFIMVVIYVVLGLVLPEATAEFSGWGTSQHWWAAGWVFLFVVPIVSGIFDTVIYKSANRFPVAIIVVFVFLLLGMGWGLWHPYWAIFLIIPIYYSLTNGIKRIIKLSNDEEDDVEIDFDDDAIEVEVEE